MKYQVKSFDVLQTSAVAAMLYFLLSLLIFVPVFLITLAFPHSNTVLPFTGIVVVFIPFLYAIAGFIFTALGCLFYNLVAKFMGGIAFTLEKK